MGEAPERRRRRRDAGLRRARLCHDWTIDGIDPDGNEVHLSGTTADVARKGPDGWRFVIDNPFGTA